jgi:cystathionine beta-synthase
MKLMITKNIIDLIGNTNLIEVNCFDTGKCKLLLKLESENPGGSIKDRIGLSMINGAEEKGLLKKGMTIIESTSGNTGIGLAIVAAGKGYPLILVIPDKMSQEKVQHMRALGADVRVTRSDVGKGHPEYYVDMVQDMCAKDPLLFNINQWDNPDNPKAHITTTGPEILKQTNGEVDAVICSVGSGGTITGLSKYFNEAKPSVDVVLADPVGSILAHYIKTGEIKEAGSWLVEGMGEDFIPPGCDFTHVKHAYEITDKESFDTVNKLLAKTGIFGGSSTGTNVAAAIKYCQEQTEAKTVVTFVCDSGAKYLSKTFNSFWLADHGLLDLKKTGDLNDLIMRKHTERACVSVAPSDSLNIAFNRMKLYDVSQLPVLKDEKIVGILDEYDVLMAFRNNSNALNITVENIMTSQLKTLTPDSHVEDAAKLIEQGLVAIIADNDNFYGLITKVDLINYLRTQA